MPAVVVCTTCRQSYHVPDQAAGRAVPCPKCGRILQSPPPSAPAAAPVATVTVMAEPVTVMAEPADRRPARRSQGHGVAPLFWLVALVWIVCSLLATVLPFEQGHGERGGAALWLIANVVTAVGLAQAVDRLCSWGSNDGG